MSTLQSEGASDASGHGRPTRQLWGYQVDQGHPKQVQLEAVLEAPLAIVVNAKSIGILMRLPGMERELAAGFCLSEGLIENYGDVVAIDYMPGNWSDLDLTAETYPDTAELSIRPRLPQAQGPQGAQVITRAGSGKVAVGIAQSRLPVLLGGGSLDLALLPRLAKALEEGQKLRRFVGGVHAGGVFATSGEMVSVAEDIGRHNAMDKAIGYCLMGGIPLGDKTFLSSGRLSYEMVSKAVRAGIGIVASMSAPTSLAVALAERCNVGLVGYVRNNSARIYTHPERFGLPPQ